MPAHGDHNDASHTYSACYIHGLYGIEPRPDIDKFGGVESTYALSSSAMVNMKDILKWWDLI